MGKPYIIQVEWISKEVETRLRKLIDKGYTGKVQFEVNMFKGGIANLNVETKESLKPEESVG